MFLPKSPALLVIAGGAAGDWSAYKMNNTIVSSTSVAFKRAGIVREGTRLGLNKGESVLVVADEVAEFYKSPCRVMIESEEDPEALIVLARVYIRELGDPLSTRQIVIAAEDGEVLAAIATDVSSNCTVLRVVAGTLQVRGPRTPEVRAALAMGRVAEVATLLDALLEDLDNPAVQSVNGQLGGWVNCRIASC